MEIGITGANGFIGNLLVTKHLKLGDKVHVLSRNKDLLDNRVSNHFGDLLDEESLISFVCDIEVLYHCAAEINDESKMKAINIEGTRNLIKAAYGKIRHWVQLSSVGVYGPVYKGIVTEEQNYNPINEYEKTKLMSDLLILEATKSKVFTSTILRPSNVFGSEMRNQSLFDLITAVDKGYYFFIGDKGASANYIAVENVIEALYLAATNSNAENKIYNISDWCTMEYFISLISEKLLKPFPKFRIPANLMFCLAHITAFIPRNLLTISRVKAMNNRCIYSTLKIERELNFKLKYTIEQGVDDLIKKYKLKV
jgi:nucleoside-diphosphate-sugar epimerase